MKKILWLVAAFAAGGALGAYQGFKAGFAMVLNSALVGDAGDVTSRLTSLGHVREGRRDKAIESLETRMDDILITFDPSSPYPGLKPHTIGALRKAIDEAKAYRSKHPHPKNDAFRGPMVRSLFERDLYR